MNNTYYKRHRKEILIKAKEYRENTKDIRKLRDSQYYKNHKEEQKIRHKKYYNKNRKKLLEKYRIYYSNNRDKIQKSQRTGKQKLRDLFLFTYGTVCACCGESHKEFLTMEHKHGQIGVTRKESGARGYKIALQEYRPDLYETLCMNCNFSKGKYGYCPHNPPVLE